MLFPGTDLSVSSGSAYQGRNRRTSMGGQYAPFANPFFDHASTYTPPDIKSLFTFCRHYALTNGIINAMISKSAEYPITDLIVQHDQKGARERWEELYKDVLDIRTRMFEINLDYYTYGIAAVSPSYPFRKKLKCSNCSAEHDAISSREMWRYSNHKFWLTCEKCGQSGVAKSWDDPLLKYSELNIIRWNPENLSIFRNETTGREEFIYTPSSTLKSQITLGRKDLVATTPDIFLEAIKGKRSLVFHPQNLFVMRRPSISAKTSQGWGVPLIMPVLKDAFLLQVMKKSMESILMTHMEPQVFLFPQPSTGGADPYVSTDLRDWRSQIQRELVRQRQDPSYFGIVPFPLGHQIIGENGRGLLIMPEIRQMAEMIAVGVGFPPDLLFGHATFAGSSVGMRMLENFFLANVAASHRLLRWLTRIFSTYLSWPEPSTTFKPFRMADDLQRQGLLVQLNKMGKVSDTTMLSMIDIDAEAEREVILTEISDGSKLASQRMKMDAEAQGEAQVVGAKFQAQAQAVMMQAQAQESVQKDPFLEAQQAPLTQPLGATLDSVASMLAAKVRMMPPKQQEVYLRQLSVESPEMGQMLMQQGVQMPHDPAMGQPMAGPGVDMRPMPEQLPPRR